MTTLTMKEENRRLFTAEALRAQSKAFLINKHSDLCELGVSVVKTTSENRLFSFWSRLPCARKM